MSTIRKTVLISWTTQKGLWDSGDAGYLESCWSSPYYYSVLIFLSLLPTFRKSSGTFQMCWFCYRERGALRTHYARKFLREQQPPNIECQGGGILRTLKESAPHSPRTKPPIQSYGLLVQPLLPTRNHKHKNAKGDGFDEHVITYHMQKVRNTHWCGQIKGHFVFPHDG